MLSAPEASAPRPDGWSRAGSSPVTLLRWGPVGKEMMLLRRHLPYWVMLIVLVSLLGYLNAWESYASSYSGGRHNLNWGRALSWDLLSWNLWVLLAPFVLLLGQRFRFDRRNWLRGLLVYVPDKHGQPVLWRFIPANNRPSPRGAGLQPLAAMPGLHLRFSDRGTAAGAGTAVQIGDKVYEAEPWPQISAPPHFVAYRGSYVFGMDLSALLLGKEKWRVITAPDELRQGAQWTLANDSGRERRLEITRKLGDEITLNEKLAPGLESASLNIVALLTPKGLALRSITLNHRDSGMRLTFTPELHLAADTPGVESEYRIDLGTREKVSQGSVTVEGKAGVINLRWRPKSPDWAKSRALSSVINPSPEGYSIEITQESR